MRNNRGFTLIELMIVVAIIGILAAIAVPAYMTYIGRSQLSEGFKVTETLRTEIAVWSANYKTFPDATAVAATGYIGSLANGLKGKYVQTNGISVAANTGVITVHFDVGSVAGKTLVLTPTLNVSNNEQVTQWQCSGTVDTKYLPTSCQ